MKEIIENLKKEYNNYFEEKGYYKNLTVPISSGIDKSVILIGSTISVLKTKLLSDQISDKGDYLIQRAIRTHSLKRELIPEKNEWSSYFDASGVLVPYELLNKLVYDVIEFINKKIDISYSDIMIRISSNDVDLMNSIRALNENIIIEIDSRYEKYYRHKYGLQEYGIYGRNFNIAIRDFRTVEYKDIGNIIVIESNSKKYGVECAIGLNAILMRKLGLPTSIDASSIVDIYKPVKDEDYKFLDCLSVVSHLAHENVIKSNKRGPQYLYRKYLKCLKYWSDSKGISDLTLLKFIKDYIYFEYNQKNDTIIENNVVKILSKGR